MLEGKVSSALRWLDAQCSSTSQEINEQVISILREKHPPAQDSQDFNLLNDPINKTESVIFDQIDAEAIYRDAITTKGSGGPTASS